MYVGQLLAPLRSTLRGAGIRMTHLPSVELELRRWDRVCQSQCQFDPFKR